MILKWLVSLIVCFTLVSTFTINQLYNMQSQSNIKGTTAFVVFNGIYPDQKLNKTDQIYLRGDNCNLTWTSGIPLSHSGNNTWTTMLSCPTGVKIQVKLLLNDKIWMMGANFWFIVYDRSNLTILPSFYPSINKVYDTQNINSSILKNSRKCSIYLPPSYHDNIFKKYKLIFMHDGQNLFEDSKAAFGTAWKIQDTLNTLIGQGQIQQVIVVGIWNTNDRMNQYTYSYDSQQQFGGKGDLYLDFIQKQLQPIVSSKWFPNRLHNENGYTIGGSSLGGLISCYAMYKRPQFFINSICMSSSFWWNNEDFNNQIITNSYNPNTVVYLDSGDAGTSQDSKNQTLRVKSHLQKIGYKSSGDSINLYYYLDKGGQHNQYYWGKRFWIPLKSLFNASIQ